jgi:hypothetical protein
MDIGKVTQAKKYGYEIWITECKEFAYGGPPNDGFEGTVQI